MNKIYNLTTYGTRRRVLSLLRTDEVTLINLREVNINEGDLDLMKKQMGSYEALFNKRAQKLKLMTEDEKPKKDSDYKKLILSEYTFLKRPAAIIDGKVYAGNDKATVEQLVAVLGK